MNEQGHINQIDEARSLGYDHAETAARWVCDGGLNEAVLEFCQGIAALTITGEDDGSGQPFEPAAEDYIETLDGLIAMARGLMEAKS